MCRVGCPATETKRPLLNLKLLHLALADRGQWPLLWGSSAAESEARATCAMGSLDTVLASISPNTVRRELSDRDFNRGCLMAGTSNLTAIITMPRQVSPEVLRLFVRPKRLQYSTFVEFMQLLVAFSTGPEEFYEQACAVLYIVVRALSAFLPNPCWHCDPQSSRRPLRPVQLRLAGRRNSACVDGHQLHYSISLFRTPWWCEQCGGARRLAPPSCSRQGAAGRMTLL